MKGGRGGAKARRIVRSTPFYTFSSVRTSLPVPQFATSPRLPYNRETRLPWPSHTVTGRRQLGVWERKRATGIWRLIEERTVMRGW